MEKYKTRKPPTNNRTTRRYSLLSFVKVALYQAFVEQEKLRNVPNNLGKLTKSGIVSFNSFVIEKIVSPTKKWTLDFGAGKISE